MLGPLLFLIFINDLPSTCSLSTWLFADDTALAVSSKNLKQLELKLNQEVDKVHNWLLANGLSVHYVDKTQYMIIRGPKQKNDDGHKFKLFMGEFEIEQTNSYTYLGIEVDDKLNWKVQINKMCAKLANICGVVSKARHYLDRKCLMTIYNSLFDSCLRYGILGWGTASEQELNRLKMLQNRVVRFITFSKFRTRAAPLYSELKIIPLRDQLFMQRSIFMHSFSYNNLPYVFDIYCHQPQHRYSTRYVTSGNYVLPRATTNRGQSSIKYTGPKAWAEVPKPLKEIAYRKPFSKKFKEHILSLNYEELPPKPTRDSTENQGDSQLEAIRSLFLDEDVINETFYGFDHFETPDLETIFATESDDDEFFGF